MSKKQINTAYSNKSLFLYEFFCPLEKEPFVDATDSILSRCSKWPPSARMHACGLLQSASTARSIASCDKSSQIAFSTVLSSALLVGFGVEHLVTAQA